MPVILAPEAWLCWPVSARVGSVKNNDPSLIEPVAIAWLGPRSHCHRHHQRRGAFSRRITGHPVHRAAAAGIAAPIGNHTFRATGIAAYLANGGALERAQEMAAHESPRTTKLYDRTRERLTQDEVERIRL
jgi:integrase